MATRAYKRDDNKMTTTDERQLNRSEAYDKTVDHIRLRVPSGWKERMAAYVFDNGDKYKSVNDMLVKLIRQELGIED